MILPKPSTLILLALSLPAHVLANDQHEGPSLYLAERFDSLHFLDLLNGVGLNTLPVAEYTVTQWGFGTVPQICVDMAADRECDVHDLEVFEVGYGDCPGYNNVICRCNDSPMSVWDVADDVGYVWPTSTNIIKHGKKKDANTVLSKRRVPVKARQWINHVGSFNAPECSAYSGGNHVVVLGDCVGRESVTIHEVAHSLDGWAIYENNGNQYSSTEEWQQTIVNDACVADNYAKARWSESWAQVAVMAAYHHNVGSIWDLDVDCMAGQLSKVIEQTEGLLKFVEGETCDRHWPQEPAVCMGDRARTEGYCDGLDDANARSFSVVPYPSDPEVQRQIEEEDKFRMRHAEEEAGLIAARYGLQSTE
ncbi:hypothetical protein QBC44DRAFT_390241 [Cladorrhinum sp. PSN332]|nr:hypothetical protein QBC44DRAFT_390241 [Cladorrhinum sp. PSN332]